jgi:hypothetical protein
VVNLASDDSGSGAPPVIFIAGRGDQGRDRTVAPRGMVAIVAVGRGRSPDRRRRHGGLGAVVAGRHRMRWFLVAALVAAFRGGFAALPGRVVMRPAIGGQALTSAPPRLGVSRNASR